MRKNLELFDIFQQLVRLSCIRELAICKFRLWQKEMPAGKKDSLDMPKLRSCTIKCGPPTKNVTQVTSKKEELEGENKSCEQKN